MEFIKKCLKKEEGSATIEFLGIIPLAILFLVILIEFVAAIHAVAVVESAANEYANVYAMTKDASEANEAANNILNSAGDHIQPGAISVTSGKEFTATVNATIDLMFLSNYFPNLKVPYSATAYGRVIE